MPIFKKDIGDSLKNFLVFVERLCMKVRLIPIPEYHYSLKHIRKNGSEGAQVVKLMESLKREADILNNIERVIYDAESFPHRIVHSSTNVIKRLLDKI